MAWSSASTRNRFSTLITELSQFHQIFSKEKNKTDFIYIAECCNNINTILFKTQFHDQDNVAITTCITGLWMSVVHMAANKTGKENAKKLPASMADVIMKTAILSESIKADMREDQSHQKESQEEIKKVEVTTSTINEMTTITPQKQQKQEVSAAFSINNKEVLNHSGTILGGLHHLVTKMANINLSEHPIDSKIIQETEEELSTRINHLTKVVNRPFKISSLLKHGIHHHKKLAIASATTSTIGLSNLILNGISKAFGEQLDHAIKSDQTHIGHQAMIISMLLLIGLILAAIIFAKCIPRQLSVKIELDIEKQPLLKFNS